MFKQATKRSSVGGRAIGSKMHASDSIVMHTASPQDESSTNNSTVDTDDLIAADSNIVTSEPLAPTAPSNASVGMNASYQRPYTDESRVVVVSGGGAAAPASPGSNRERFMSNCQPLKVCCDLSVVGLHSNSTRFSFQAVVLIVYPATFKPARRHLQLIDSRGSTGITVWNEHVSMFSASSVGQVVRFSKLSLISQNGQKSLSMSRDSTVNFVSDAAAACEESKWWRSLLGQKALRIIDIHGADDNIIVNVSGILGTMTTEMKRVRNEDRELLCMRITDRTGFIDVRSWTHSEMEFDAFRERPILFKRVRVTSFAGLKIIELLDASGTEVVHADFEGAADLAKYWSE